MKKNTISLITLFIIIAFQMFSIKLIAANIDEATARQYGAYYLSVMTGENEAELSQVTLAYTFMNDDLKIPAAYVFNVENQGCVVVSGSDLWYPILGYSTEDMFDVNRVPLACKEYLEELCDYIVYAQNTGIAVISNIENEWMNLKNRTWPQVSTPKSNTWLLDSEWGQGDAYTPTYNKYCPYRDIDGVRMTAYTGCVATAMSQIMYYWKYPVEPIDDTMHYLGCMIDDTVLFGDIAIDMSPVVYNFDTMPNKLTSTSTTAEIDAIALLCYHAGVSVQMGYGITGSGAFSSNVPIGLSEIFLYDTMATYEPRKYYYVDGSIVENYTNDEWVAILAEEIAASRPVYYAGCGMDEDSNYVGGHAFVCDGHHTTDTNMFHFNWGWDGYLNMWCDVRNSDIGGTDINFDYFQEIVRYIQPRPEPTCEVPTIESIVVDHESAVLSWSGNAQSYQLIYKETSATTWSDTITTIGTRYTIENLLPETDYMVTIRGICDEELGNSMWCDTTFSTVAFVCPIPTEFTAIEVGYEDVVLVWNSEAPRWVIHLFNDEYNFMDTVDDDPILITGLTAGTEYSALIKGICSDTETSEWSEPISFTTMTCSEVITLEASEITTNSALITWDSPDALAWEVNYGIGIAPGEGESSMVIEKSCIITSLELGTTYDVYVRLACDENTYGQWINKLTFTTLDSQGINGVDDNIQFIIYPNPSSGATSIRLNGVEGKITISIVDINGRIITCENMECGSDCEKVLDVEGLARGTYFVKALGGNVNSVRKLIVR